MFPQEIILEIKYKTKDLLLLRATLLFSANPSGFCSFDISVVDASANILSTSSKLLIVNQVSSKVADAIDVVNIDVDEAKFYLGIGLVTETKALILIYDSRKSALLEKFINN